jgi:hypothetical protein
MERGNRLCFGSGSRIRRTWPPITLTPCLSRPGIVEDDAPDLPDLELPL